MAEIQIFEDGNEQTAGYFANGECLTVNIKWDTDSYSCVWTPSLPPLAALIKLQGLGLIHPTLSRGDVKLAHTEFKESHWRDAMRKVTALKDPRIHHIRLGTDIRTIGLEPSEYIGYGLCCAVRGTSESLAQFGTALMLTASRSLVFQFNAMHYRLISHPPARRAYPQSG